MTSGERLRLFINRYWRTISQFADAFGWDSGSLYKYFNGRQRMGHDLLVRLFEMGCNVNWLLTGSGDMVADTEAGRLLREGAGLSERVVSEPVRDYRTGRLERESIPLMLSPISAGDMIQADNAIMEMVNVSQMVAPDPENYFAIVVAGNSMRAAGIANGTYITIERTAQPNDGDIVAARIDGEFVPRRYRLHGQNVYLYTERGENEERIRMPTDGSITIEGVARWFIGHIR